MKIPSIMHWIIRHPSENVMHVINFANKIDEVLSSIGFQIKVDNGLKDNKEPTNKLFTFDEVTTQKQKVTQLSFLLIVLMHWAKFFKKPKCGS
jgi:hypothetical protein